MKHYISILFLSCSLASLFSCTQQKTETKEVEQIEQNTDEVRCVADYFFTDSLMQGSHRVVYTIQSQSDDELPLVVDEDGIKYKDIRFSLVITKDGGKLFDRSFTKADFKSMLSEEFQQYGIMDGLRFNSAEDGKLLFNTCVSYPESDMTCPFILTIDPDGSYTITPDTTVDDEELPSV